MTGEIPSKEGTSSQWGSQMESSDSEEKVGKKDLFCESPFCFRESLLTLLLLFGFMLTNFRYNCT